MLCRAAPLTGHSVNETVPNAVLGAGDDGHHSSGLSQVTESMMK